MPAWPGWRNCAPPTTRPASSTDTGRAPALGHLGVHRVVQQAIQDLAVQPAQQILGEGTVDEHERHPRGTVRAVFPPVDRAALHNHVTRAEHGLAVVEDQHDLALEHYAV